MNIPDFFTLLCAAETGSEETPVGRGLLVLRVFSLNATHISVLLSLAGFAMLTLLVAPQRHGRAALRIAVGPFAAWALGCVVLLLVGAGLLLLFKAGIVPGRPLLATLLFSSLAAGVSVTARALGARVLDDRGPLAQTALGVAVLVLTLSSPFGLVTLGLAGPLGLGALLLARR